MEAPASAGSTGRNGVGTGRSGDDELLRESGYVQPASRIAARTISRRPTGELGIRPPRCADYTHLFLMGDRRRRTRRISLATRPDRAAWPACRSVRARLAPEPCDCPGQTVVLSFWPGTSRPGTANGTDDCASPDRGLYHRASSSRSARDWTALPMAS